MAVELKEREILSQEDFQEPMDFARLKNELLVTGIRLDDSASEGIGTVYKEQIHFLFDIDFGHHKGIVYPAEIILPGSLTEEGGVNEFGRIHTGLICAFRGNDRSPFLIRREGDRLLLEKNGNYLCNIKYFPRPPYYSKRTSDGTPMSKLVVHGGLVGLFSCFNHYCHYFKDGDECRFCNLFATSKVYDDQVRKKKADQVAEAVAAAWEDGICQLMVMSGGILPGRSEIDSYIEAASALKKVRKWPNPDSLPIMAVAGAPAPDKHSDLKRLKEAGFRYVAINLELWDKQFFTAVCPGKAKNGGWENWVKALEEAVNVFGFGNVRSNFVGGIEPMEDTLEGLKYLTDKGVWAFFTPWCPDPGSRFWGHRSPGHPWYWELSERLASIWEESALTIEGLSRIPGANDILPFDIWRIWQGKTVEDLILCEEKVSR